VEGGKKEGCNGQLPSVFPHPDSSTFFLFPKVKGHKFDTTDNIQKNVAAEFNNTITNDSSKYFQKL
jgi:hypothetical protein